jgi:HAD superfamily hydrolase (TIGR01509 family)
MKPIIFDIGGVVLDWRPGQLLERFYPDAAERERMQPLIFLHADWLELDRGALSEAQILARIAQRAGRPCPELDSLFAAIRDSLVPKPDTVALLETLAEAGRPLYCLSNMPAGIYHELRALHDFWRHFRGIVVSGLVGLVKPDPRIYEHLLASYGLRAADTIFIDDLQANVDAAKAVGLTGLHFQSAAQVAQALQQLQR